MHAANHTPTDHSLWGQIAFVVAASYAWVFVRNRPEFEALSTTFVSIVLEALPFVLIGTLIGGFIEVFVSKERISGLLPEGRGVTILIAAGLGAFFPVCECAIVPVVRRLLNKGVPLGAAVAFLLGGPIVNPVVAASTAVAYSFQWTVVIDRMLLGYIAAAAVGTLMDLLFRDQALRKEGRFPDACCGKPHEFRESIIPLEASAAFPVRFSRALRHAADDFADIARYLIIRAFFAGLVKMMVFRPALAVIANSHVGSILFMMILAILMNLCSEADAFVAASFRPLSISISAQMAFMVLGPMLDIKLLLMYRTLFRKKAMVFLASLSFSTVFLLILLWERIFW